MTNFDVKPIISDFEAFKTIFKDYLQRVPDDAWQKRTGTRDKDWTLHQLLAHLVSIAAMFNHAAEAALNDTSLSVEGFTQRTDLREWNTKEIDSRKDVSHSELSNQFIAELDKSISILESATSEQTEKKLHLPVYNRPARMIEFIDWQLSHAGIIHASQITRPIDNVPLWEHYSSAMMKRQIDRYIRHFSYAYWQDYAPDINETLNFHIDGDAGGNWYLVASPDGGVSGQGSVEEARFNIHFASPQILFGVFSVHLPMMEALSSGQMKVEGDPQQALNILKLFAASPPRST